METDTFTPLVFPARSRTWRGHQGLTTLTCVFFQCFLLLALTLGTEAENWQDRANIYNQVPSLSGPKLTTQPGLDVSNRLLKVLQLDNVLSRLMVHQHVKPEEVEEDSSQPVAEPMNENKRVFCNGFTGCGGRFRGRRRQYQQQKQKKSNSKRILLLMKRPFCNTYGCYNGRKRNGEFPTKLNDDQSQIEGQSKGEDTRLALGNNVDNVNVDDVRASSLILKRLFCNGFGGCRNAGKRSRVLPLLELPRRNDPFNLQQKSKRFFAAQYDMSAQQFADDMSG